MNAPDRFEKFVLPEGVSKVSYEKNTKIANAGTFRIELEDHTLGNMIRMQLHLDKDILFSGYKVPHPLQKHILVKVQTTDNKTPIQAMDETLQALYAEFEDIRLKFVTACEELHQEQQVDDSMAY